MTLKLLSFYDYKDLFKKDLFNYRVLEEVYYLRPDDDFYIRVNGVSNNQVEIEKGIEIFLKDLNNTESANYKNYFESVIQQNDSSK